VSDGGLPTDDGKGANEECTILWDKVSYYSALKDNYFNSIIVATMSNYELPITNYDDEQSPSNIEGVPEGRGSLYETLRFLFNYRGQYVDNLSITETYLAENNYTEALITLSRIYGKFKLTEEQVLELKGLEIYINWLQQLEKEQNSIYSLSESELEYLRNYVETHTGRGVVFANNILCELYGICPEDERMRGEKNEIPRFARNDEVKSPSNIEGVPEGWGSLLENITIHPNPTTGELKIENGELKIENVEIYDVFGKKLSSHHLIVSSSNHLINISHLNSGIYFVKVYTDAGEMTKKIVKQ